MVGQEKAGIRLVGEPPGGGLDIYGDVKVVTLPASKIVVLISARYHERAPGDPASRSHRTSRSRSAGRTTSPAATRSSRRRSSPDRSPRVPGGPPYLARRWRACGSSSRAAAARAGRGSCATCASTATRSSTSTYDPTASRPRRRLVTDLTDLGQAQDALAGADAVVHFAAIPAPGLRPEGETFRINALSTYNVFQAAVDHRMKRVVWASSETVLGLPFDIPPAFAPIDETIEPHPESSYSLSKLVGETMATQFARRSGIGFVGLRISNIMAPEDYAAFPSYWDDARIRKWNLWGYVDARDVASAAGSRWRLRSRAPRSRSSPRPRRS